MEASTKRHMLTVLRCPYVAGNTLYLHLEHGFVQADILKVFKPFTLSCAMVVQVHEGYEGLPNTVVLKVYDRRFATQFRSDERLPPWSTEIEEQYRQVVLNGEVKQFFDMIDSGEHRKDEIQKSVVYCEAYLQYRLDEMFEDEMHAYHLLSDYQGKNIPEFYCSVKLQDDPGRELSGKYTAISGILIQYIDGFPFEELPAHAPKELWQSIGEDAIRIIRCLHSRDVLNADVSSRSIIICKDEDNKFRVFMIDFALCQFREDAEDDTQWWKWIRFQNEEGDLAFSIQRRLEGNFVFNRSEFYQMLDRELGTD